MTSRTGSNAGITPIRFRKFRMQAGCLVVLLVVHSARLPDAYSQAVQQPTERGEANSAKRFHQTHEEMIFKNDDPQNPTYLVIARSGDDESRFYERLVLEAKSDGEVASMRKFNLAKGSGLLSLPQKRGSQTIRNEILALSDDQESLRYRILERRSGRMRSESTTWQRLSKTERDLVTQHFAKERQRKRLEQERKERERQEALARARAARERSEDAFFNGLMLLGQLAVSLDDSAGGGSNGRKSGSDLKVLTVQLLDKAGKKPVDGFDPKVEIKDGFGVWQKYCTPDQHWGKFSVSVPDRCDEIRVTWRSESQIVSVRGKSSLELRFGN